MRYFKVKIIKYADNENWWYSIIHPQYINTTHVVYEKIDDDDNIKRYYLESRKSPCGLFILPSDCVVLNSKEDKIFNLMQKMGYEIQEIK